jgi:hypothetical protein
VVLSVVVMVVVVPTMIFCVVVARIPDMFRRRNEGVVNVLSGATADEIQGMIENIGREQSL